jgi:hypothetical protein
MILLFLAACMSQLEADCRSACDLYWSTCESVKSVNGEPDPVRSDEYAAECEAACPVNAEDSRRETEDWTACVDDHREEVIEYDADAESCGALKAECEPTTALFNPGLTDE